MNFKKWLEFEDSTSLNEWVDKKLYLLNETDYSRYGVNINYRSKMEDVLDNFAKICLGFVSAAIKKHDYHVKHMFDENPIRIFVSNRNWDDGEWIVVVSFDASNKCFLVSKGFYNKDRQTVAIQGTHKCNGTSPAEITSEVVKMMHSLKSLPDRHVQKLNPVPLKRGPKK